MDVTYVRKKEKSIKPVSWAFPQKTGNYMYIMRYVSLILSTFLVLFNVFQVFNSSLVTLLLQGSNQYKD